MDPKVPLGELTEQEVTEIDRPNAVGTLFEADVFMLQRASHEQLPAVEPNGPRGTDEPNDVMARIFRGGQRARIHAGRRLPKPRGALLTQGFVRSFMVVGVAEPIELPLLPHAGERWRPSGLGLQGAVHPLVDAVLFRMARLDAHRPNAQTNPPDTQGAEAVNPERAEGGPVVALDRGRQPDLAKEPLEDRLRLGRADRGERGAPQQVARVLIRNGQRITVLPVAGAELTFEVGGPQIIGCLRDRARRPGMLPMVSSPSGRNQAAAPEQVARRAGGGPFHLGPTLVQPRQQLAGAPARMLAPRLHDRRRHPRVHAMGAVMRRAAPLEEPGRAAHVIPIEPFVTSSPADAVARTQFRHRVEATFRVRREAHPFLHRLRLRPGHVHLPVNTLCGVTYAPGQICYLCTRSIPPQVEKLARRPARLVILTGAARSHASGRVFAAVDGQSGHMAITGLPR